MQPYNRRYTGKANRAVAHRARPVMRGGNLGGLLRPIPAKRCVVLVLAMLMANCAPLTRHDAPIDTVSQLPENWLSAGKIALQPSTTGASINRVLRYRLQQRGEDFTLRLSGAFGLGAVLVEQQGDRVTMRRGDELLGDAESSEALLEQLTGLALPVSLLRYWLSGRPGPTDQAAVFSRSASGFEQAGWTVAYLSLGLFDGLTLPRKLRAQGEQGKLTIVVSEWQAAR
ncbi:MAG: outer membrane lipoprotein LolB [Pseudomonadales bacterium]|nr:outer membrane lipoprotein LolB [Pseudomonadales bacterium]